MKRFACSNCDNEVHFDSTACVACNAWLAYDPDDDRMSASTDPAELRLCANSQIARCNWVAEPGEPLCLSCSRTRTIPDLDFEGNDLRWARLEQAKRHLFRSLIRLGLSFPAKTADPERGLAFDFLADTVLADGTVQPVTTGHAGGVVTIDIAEADEAEREGRREKLGESYRTLLGHMRHEIAHYYWERLVDDPGRHDGFRAVFGDEREDYQSALSRHYAQGPQPGWQSEYISAYATAHPWEDFAESWAHYLHVVDGLETARAYGIFPTVAPASRMRANIETDPYRTSSFDSLVEDFVPLTIAMNALNRSIGQPDFYPFVLSMGSKSKLAYIHDLVRSS